MLQLHSLLTETRLGLFTAKLAFALILALSSISGTNAQAANTIPLEVSNFSFTPPTIDTTNSSQFVTVNIRATNTVSDVRNIFVGFRSQTGNQFVRVSMDSRNRISGDNRDGVYQALATFPQYSKAGKWYVFEITAFDSSNNYRHFYYADILARNFPTELQVINDNEDVTPPEISDFGFTPTAIHTTNDVHIVTITARVTDAKSGVRSVSVGFAIPNEDFVYGVTLNRISGDEKDGIYRGTARFSQNTQSGIYHAHVYASDALLNSKFLGASDLAQRGYSSQLRVNQTVSSTLVSISGRVLNAKGRGLPKAVVNLVDSNGIVTRTSTNAFGYYRFNNVRLGETYNLEVQHKQFSFAGQVLFVDKELSDLNISENSPPGN